MMAIITEIENRLKVLEGGIFQKMMDDYLGLKYFSELKSYGVQYGTNKPIIGVPDSYIAHEDGTYTLIMYGTSAKSVTKMKSDLADVLNKNKVNIDNDLIKQIILVSTADRISVEDNQKLKKSAENIPLQILTLRDIAMDINQKYPRLAKDYLDIQVDSNQIFSQSSFIEHYDKNHLMAPLELMYIPIDSVLEEIKEIIMEKQATLIMGAPGVGKTRTVLEIAKYFETIGYEVIVIKNNGLPLYNDIRVQIDERKQYLVIFDDVNQTKNLDAILSFFQEQRPRVKIVGTARLYEVNNIRKKFQRFDQQAEISMTGVSDIKIDEILERSMDIKNDGVRKDILKIAKGNPRIAVLAAKLAKRELKNIETITDLFKAHFNPLLEKNELTIIDIKTLFVLSYFGKVNIENNKNANMLVEYLSITKFEYEESLQRLTNFELIDIYLGIPNVTDQIFKDYIIEYVLLDKKLIKISELIKMFYVSDSERLITILNTQLSMFNDSEYFTYLQKEVKELWRVSDEKLSNYLLETFYVFDELKALSMIRERSNLWSSTVEKREVTEDIFERDKKNHNIKISEIKILAGFKRLEYMPNAIRLLSQILLKRPDYILDVYMGVKEYLPTKDSYQNDYEIELKFLKEFWKHFFGKSENHDRVVIQIMQEFLNISYSITEFNDTKSVRFISWDITLTDGVKELRNFIWQNLSIFYQDDRYKNIITKFLYSYSWYGREDFNVEILKFDFECIKKYIDIQNVDISFSTYMAFRRLNKLGIEKNVTVQNYFKINEISGIEKYLVVLELLSDKQEWDYEKGIDLIRPKINNYNMVDIGRLFRLAKSLEKLEYIKQQDFLVTTLKITIQLSDIECLDEIMNEYFKSGAPYTQYVCTVLQEFNIKTRKMMWEIIHNNKTQEGDIWRQHFWNTCESTEITDDMMNEFSDHLNLVKQGKYDVPRISTLLLFDEINPDILLEGTKIANIFATYENQMAGQFLDSRMNENLLVSKFKDNLEVLEELYLKGLSSNHFDYQGELFSEILNLDENFALVCISYLNEHFRLSDRMSIMFERIWQHKNGQKLIADVLNLAVTEFMFFDEYKSMFSQNNDVSTADYKYAIESFIKAHKNNKKSVVGFFGYYVNTLPLEERLYYWEFLLQQNIDVEHLLEIPLTPMSWAWSGSQIPLIDQDIEFITELLKIPVLDKNDDYFDLVLMWKERKQDQVDYRKRTLIKEYVEPW
ncbi:ATP-binding protein [Weissella tructae]|nr:MULTISPECIES: ATP-binding protein [Weissella]